VVVLVVTVKATACSVCVVVVVDVLTESVTLIVGRGSPVGFARHVGVLATRTLFLRVCPPDGTLQVQVTQLGWMVVAEHVVLVIVRTAGVIVVVVLVTGVRSYR
jgi:hypothetical protein